MPQVQYLGAWITKKSTAVDLGVLPANFNILRTICEVTEAFNAGTLNQISIGYTGTQEAFATLTTVSSTGRKTMTAGTSQKQSATARKVTVYTNLTGTAPTTGKAYVGIEYILTPTSPA